MSEFILPCENFNKFFPQNAAMRLQWFYAKAGNLVTEQHHYLQGGHVGVWRYGQGAYQEDGRK